MNQRTTAYVLAAAVLALGIFLACWAPGPSGRILVPQPTAKFAALRLVLQPRYPRITPPKLPNPMPLIALLPRDYIAPRPYKDTPCQCEPDPAAAAALQQLRKPAAALTDQLVALAHTAIWSADPALAAWAETAAAAALNAQPETGAFSGQVNTQGMIDRMTGCHITMAVIALRLSPGLLKPAAADWLVRLAAEQQAEFLARTNNLRAWCLLGMALAGTLGGNAAMVQEAARAWDDTCATQLGDSGQAVSEVRRGAKSGPYHEFLAAPLVVAAHALGKDHPRLHALVNYVLSLPPSGMPRQLAWLHVYDRLYGPLAIAPAVRLRYDSEVAKARGDPMYRTVFGGSILYLVP